MPVIFALASFLAAALLFAVQPMAGKAVLPTFGGSPAVWTTCLVYFQLVLLLGYLYAHAIGRLTTKQQVILHAIVLTLGGITRWLAGSPTLSELEFLADWPVFGVLARLALLTLGPAFALSSTAPLIQRWFGLSGRNPYALYAASNAGSFVGLLGYPLLIEPRLDLTQQFQSWLIGYAATAVVLTMCGLLALRWARTESVASDRPLSSTGRWSWLLLAALPSSLLSSVTSHLTTDIAPVPLLWVVPLAIYLLTFIIAFGRWPAKAQRILGRVTPMGLCFVTVALLARSTEPVVTVAVIHLIGFAMVALLCNGELARTRPPAADLTRFYLIVSFGGVLGGSFNALVAPILFSSMGPIEYPLAICLAALVRPPNMDGSRPAWIGRDDAKWLAILAVITLALVLIVPRLIPIPDTLDGVDAMLRRLARYGLTAGVPTVIAFALVRRPGRFAVALALLFLIGSLDPGLGKHLVTMRNSLGTLRVSESADGRFVQITHGTTLHGQQFRDSAERPKPLMYYHPTGPAGGFLEKWPNRRRIGAVGLGCGALAGYGREGESWTFFELDPNVIRIAQDERYFTFLSTCPSAMRIVAGDARRQLRVEPDNSFDVLILDAFNSDSVPTHLLTKEAFELYFQKLSPDGVLLIHASNRYLDLPGLIARTCEGFAVRRDFDMPTDSQKADGKFTSDWLIVARRNEVFEPLAKDYRWQKVAIKPGPVWRDSFTDLIGIWKRGEE